MHIVARQATGGLLDAGDVDGAVFPRRPQRSRIAVPAQGRGLREASDEEGGFQEIEVTAGGDGGQAPILGSNPAGPGRRHPAATPPDALRTTSRSPRLPPSARLA